MLPTRAPLSVKIPMHSLGLPSLASIQTFGKDGCLVGSSVGTVGAVGVVGDVV